MVCKMHFLRKYIYYDLECGKSLGVLKLRYP